MSGYINKTGLFFSGLASLFLTLSLFSDMASGEMALVFIAIGIAAELGKYSAIYQASAYDAQEKKTLAFAYIGVTVCLVAVSLAGSAGALLSNKNEPLPKYQRLESRIADIDSQIAVELQAMKRASDVNAQTAGVAPARDSLDKLTAEKAELSKELDTMGQPEASALVVALLLEGLCLLFGVANLTTDRRVFDIDSKPDPHKETLDTAEEGDRFTILVAAIQARQLKPTYENIRSFMNVGAGKKVKEIRERLLSEGLVLEGSGGCLVPV